MDGQSKEHRAGSRPPSIARERKRESRPGSERERQLPPPPFPLPVAPTASAFDKPAEQLWGDIDHSWFSFSLKPGPVLFQTWKRRLRSSEVTRHFSGEGVADKNVSVVPWDLSHGPLGWQQTHNYGEPHSHTTVCHCVSHEGSLGNNVFSSATKTQLFSGKSLLPLDCLPKCFICLLQTQMGVILFFVLAVNRYV